MEIESPKLPGFVLVMKSKPPNMVFMKTKRGEVIVGFASADDAAFYIQRRGISHLYFKTLARAAQENPPAFASQPWVLYLNRRASVELLLQNAEDFPYDEFIISLL